MQANESRGVSAKQTGDNTSSTQSRSSAIDSQTRTTPLPSKETLERLAEKLKELVGEDFQLPGQQVRYPSVLSPRLQLLMNHFLGLESGHNHHWPSSFNQSEDVQ